MGDGVVDPERNDGHDPIRNAEEPPHVVLHLGRVNEDMIGQPILDSQGKAIERRVLRISLARINVVRGEDDLLSQQLVVQHQKSSIEELEFVVP